MASSLTVAANPVSGRLGVRRIAAAPGLWVHVGRAHVGGVFRDPTFPSSCSSSSARSRTSLVGQWVSGGDTTFVQESLGGTGKAEVVSPVPCFPGHAGGQGSGKSRHGGDAASWSLLLLDSTRSPTRMRRLHLLELRVLAASWGVSLSACAGPAGWLWSVDAASQTQAGAATRALAREASGLRGALVDAVSACSGEALVAAASSTLRQNGSWALRRESGGTKNVSSGDSGRTASIALAAAIGGALGGQPAADGCADIQLATVALGEDANDGQKGTLFLGRWVSATSSLRWPARLECFQQRPFHFTGGLDLRIAEACVSLALTDSNDRSRGRRILFIDPCCGSGTTLLTALWRASGSTSPLAAMVALDVNRSHVRGALQNLHHAGIVANGCGQSARVMGVMDEARVIAGAGHGTAVASEGGGWVRCSATDGADVWLNGAARDASVGQAIAFPPAHKGKEESWRIAGVANFAWGQKVAATQEQVDVFLRGFLETCTAFGPCPCRICFILGPSVDAATALRGAGWRILEGPVPVFRSNSVRADDYSRPVLCNVTVVEPEMNTSAVPPLPASL